MQIFNLMTVLSPFRDVALDGRPTLHRVLESSELMGMIAGRSPEMRLRGCSVF